MKTEFQTKLLSHLISKKKDNAGFTLIELLVVIIIIGILSAIALPSFLNQANKAKQSEAKTYVGSLNRAQQAYFLEETKFAKGDATIGSKTNKSAIDALGIGIPTKTSNYAYLIQGNGTTEATAGAQQIEVDEATGTAKDQANSPLKAYVGGVAIANIVDTGESTTIAVLCGADKSEKAKGPDGTKQIDYAKLAPDTGDSDPEEACKGAGGYKPLKK